jgi:hypothetical protein
MRKAKKSAQIEVLAPVRRPSEEAQAMLAKLVEQKVSEALSGKSGDSIFEPFFQPAAIEQQMRKQMTVPQREKFAAYYEKWGCLRCDTKKKIHSGLGMCGTCHALIRDRLKVCIQELDAERPLSIPTLDRTDMAQQAILAILKGKR